MLPFRHSNANSQGNYERSLDDKRGAWYKGPAGPPRNQQVLGNAYPMTSSVQKHEYSQPLSAPTIQMRRPLYETGQQNYNINSSGTYLSPVTVRTTSMLDQDVMRMPPPQGLGARRKLTYSPVSPRLDQVLTLSSPPQGAGNVTWMYERKRDRVSMETKKMVLVIAVVLLLVGFMFWNSEAYNGDKRNFAMEDISVSVDTTNHVETEHGFVTDSFIGTVMDQIKHTSANETGQHVNKFIEMPIPEARVIIMYSINEDDETTLELIEG